MKKLFYILLAISSLYLFSSCVVVYSHPNYNISFENDTTKDVDDWYVENINGNNFAKSDTMVTVKHGNKSTVHDLCPDYYRVRFSYDKDHYYYKSDYTYLDEDIIFILSKNHFYSRTASASPEDIDAELILTDNRGKIYELTKIKGEN